VAEIAGFAIVAAVALYVVWPLIERRPAAPATARVSDEIADLISRRDTLYRELADLDFDHRLGKVDDDDYREQREDYLDEAALVLERLDSAAGAPELGGSLPPARIAEIEAEVRRLRGQNGSR
jgi:hypothetical protein